MKRKMIDRSLFAQPVAPPENRYTAMSVTIYPDGRFGMNGRIAGKLGGKALYIKFTADSKNLILAEASDRGEPIMFPKNGTKVIPHAAEIVKAGKLPLPAKYDVWLREDGDWQGDYCENPTQPPAGKRRDSRKACATHPQNT